MKGKVLVVDDDKAMCELIETTLTMKGYSTRWCQNATEANDLLHGHEFDVVLTDIRMPFFAVHQLRRGLERTSSRSATSGRSADSSGTEARTALLRPSLGCSAARM